MSSEGEDELRTEGTLPKSRVEASNAGGSVDDATQVVRLSDSAAADSADQLKTLLQSAEVPSAGFEPAELVGVGRYRLDRVLGEGAFGRVYLGYDTELRRAVAVKVPAPGRFSSAAELENYLSEARMAAQLDHPNVVTVYDAGRTAAGGVWVVSRYIDGGTLESEIRAGGLTERETVRLLIPVARALHAAHLRKIIHRDVKPANILISRAGRIPYVADFGLAIHGDQHPAEYAIAGTPAYMSPEQARGEGHRLDGRSDLFSLGVVMYEMLTDSRPFRGGSLRETLSQVISAAPRSLREFRARIPSELERICLKALAKRAVDRYGDLEEFADELQSWFDGNGAGGAGPSSNLRISEEVRLVPRGLQCFTREDAAAFLQLLPGPVDREGLAESVSFWVRRLSGSDAGPPLLVGVIYGPSGCGKSSLMRAGIVPRLAAGVDVVYVEAAGGETERRLETALRRCVPGLPVNEDLAGLLAVIRQRRLRRLVLVIDQLEQWLSGQQLDADSLLVRALRQCEGEYLKAVLLVRDDFALGTARLMGALEIPMRQGENTAVVDLFDEEHAERVLEQFGRAWGRLPREGVLSASQRQFLRMAVEQVSESGRVVCVRLVVLAELVRQREWEPRTLQELGGAEGAGVAYLESVFEGRGANPALRMQSEAARRLLRVMLPAGQLVIRGSARTLEELRAASGLGLGDGRFEQLMNVLDRDLRLLTPIDSELDAEAAAGVNSGESRVTGSRYQLTHDFLVPSIHAWLSRRQRETLRGRTELLLAERAGSWNLRRTAGNLPSLREWLWIRCLVSSSKWTADERRLMRAAARQHLQRWGLAGAAGLALVGVFRWNAERLEQRQMLDRMAAEVDALRDVRGTELTRAVGELTSARYPQLMLRQRLLEERDRESDAGRRLPLALALAALDVDESEYLTGQVLNPLLPDSAVLAAGLVDRAEAAVAAIAVRMEALKAPRDLQQRARLALLALQLGESRWAEAMCRSGVADPIERVWWIREASTWGGFGSSSGELELTGSSDLNAALMLALRPAVGVRMTRDAEDRLLLRVQQLVRSADSCEHAAAVRLLAVLSSSAGESPDSLAAVQDETADWRSVNDGLTLIRIPGDSGAASSVPSAVWMSDHEVTQGLFQRFVDDPAWPADQKPEAWEGPDRDVGNGPDHPVQQVSRTDAVQFCNWLSRRCGLATCYERQRGADGTEVWVLNGGVSGFRLPTESEWERACRWGTTTAFHCSDDESFLPDYARISSVSTLPVGSLLPNAGGLYDMHGNVMEWCEPEGGERIDEYPVRGGAFLTGPADSESSFSMRYPGTDRYDLAGFRVVLIKRLQAGN